MLHSFRVLQVGYVRNKGDSGILICVFSQPVPQQEVPHVIVDDVEATDLSWFSPTGDNYSHVWVSRMDVVIFPFNTVAPLMLSSFNILQCWLLMTVANIPVTCTQSQHDLCMYLL